MRTPADPQLRIEFRVSAACVRNGVALRCDGDGDVCGGGVAALPDLAVQLERKVLCHHMAIGE